MRTAGLLIVTAFVAAVAGCGGADAQEDDLPGHPKPRYAPAGESGSAHSLAIKRVASGFNRPTFVGAAPGDVDGIWILEQPGRVVRLGDGGGRRVVLDLTGEVKVGAEQGLLGIAFHPDFRSNRRVFLHWNDGAGDTRVAEFEVEGGAVEPASRRYLLRLEQSEENHKGGQLAFGPDGRLYLGLGDGGGAFDPTQAAQDRERLLGKIVSLDVDRPGSRWRIELYGLRNPWRFSFDPALGELWVADVGQDEYEEINRVLPEPDEPPKNLGWGVFEGVRKVNRPHSLDQSGEVVWPVATYTHEDGCSVIGGYVYHGTELPKLSGRYVYGDFCAGALWSLRPAPHGRVADVRRERAAVPQLTHIGIDGDGEMVFASAQGGIYAAVRPR